MRLRIRIAIALSITATFLPTVGQSQASQVATQSQPLAFPDASSPTHGTINLLLANRNGAVLVTDSRISEGFKPTNDHARKLFRLDDKTVCSIANFFYDPGPPLNRTRPNNFTALFRSVDGLVTSFSEGLPIKLTVEEKADALAQYIGFELVMLETEKRASSNYPGPTASQQLIVVGYEADGSLTAVKRVVSVEPDDPKHPLIGPVHSHLDQPDTKYIRDSFVSMTAGADLFAQEHLQKPENFADDNQMDVYRRAHQMHTESQLTLQELEALAAHLKEVSETGVAAMGAPVIGGDIQKAILVDGKVNLPDPKEPFLAFPKYQQPTYLIHVTASNVADINGGLANTTTVIINTVCNAASGVMLDGSVILGGKYDNCNLYFDGRAFYFDPKNVSMKSATLVIGPHWNDQVVDSAVASLPSDIKIVCWKDLAIPQDLQRATIWSVGYSPDEESAFWSDPTKLGQVWEPLVHLPAQVKAIHDALSHCANR
jgi:hypothetical protein